MRIWSCSLLAGSVIFLVFTLFSYGSGCSPRSGINTYTADDGTTIVRMIGNQIERTTTRGNYYSCDLDAERCQGGNGNVTYSLLSTIRYSDTYVPGNIRVCLTLVVDGRTAHLAGKEVSRQGDPDPRNVTSSVRYPISSEFLRDLAKAQEVDLEFSGEFGTFRTYLSSSNIANFKRFYEKYGNPAEQSATQRQ
jgi:hypothetical protein